MTEPSPYGDATDDDAGPGLGPTTGTPRWVKVFAIIALVAILLFLVLTVTGGGGDHGPGRHSGSGGHAEAPPASVSEGHRPPEGGH